MRKLDTHPLPAAPAIAAATRMPPWKAYARHPPQGGSTSNLSGVDCRNQANAALVGGS